MNQNLWLRFWIIVQDPVFYQKQPYVDLAIVSKDEYPALHKLDDIPTLEILILSFLITNIRMAERGFNDIYFDIICQLFEHYDCTDIEIDQALINLHNRRWVQFYVDEQKNEFIYEADLLELTKAGLYIPDNDTTLKLTREISTN